MRRTISIAIFLQLLLVQVGTAQPRGAQERWLAAWASAQQIAEPQNMLPEDARQDVTLRQIVHLSAGGSHIQMRFSNALGSTPLLIDDVRVAIPSSPSQPTLQPATDHAVTFSGRSSVLIPAGAEYLSDPVELRVLPFSNLAITLHVNDVPARETAHPGSRATSYVLPGDKSSDPDFENARKIQHWYFLSEVDVRDSPIAASVAVLGDSITDGHGATTDANDRWTDVLARRLQEKNSRGAAAVLNLGLGGNRLLNDGLGPNALARFERDILARPGVRSLVVLEGINDLGTLGRLAEVPAAQHEELVRRMIAAYQQMIRKAHAQGILVYGATILPDGGSDYYHPGPVSEADRQAVNQWIRTSGSSTE